VDGRSLYRGCDPDHGSGCCSTTAMANLGRNERGVSAVFGTLGDREPGSRSWRRRTAGPGRTLSLQPAAERSTTLFLRSQAQRDREHSGARPHQRLHGAEVAGVTGPFISAIWDYAFYEDTALVITFGTDRAWKRKRAGTTSPEWELRMRKRSPIPSTHNKCGRVFESCPAIFADGRAFLWAGVFRGDGTIAGDILWRCQRDPLSAGSGSG